jgi:hypothetical protein
METKKLVLGLVVAGSLLLSGKPAKAEFVDVDQGINSVYSNQDYNDSDNWNRRRCYTEKRFVRYDHNGYPIYRFVENCNRYRPIRSIINNRWWFKDNYRHNNNWDWNRNRDHNDRHDNNDRDDRGGIRIRLGF